MGPHSLLPLPSSDLDGDACSRPHGVCELRRKKIAVLFDYMAFLSDVYESRLREALHAKSREYDVDLVFVYGRALDEPHPHCASSNAIFEHVHPEASDGVIVLSTCLAAHGGSASVARLMARFEGLPCCSIGVELPRVPSVLVDNQRGMASAVEHLISVHGCRRLAFIAGSPGNAESEVRLNAYRSTLESHGIAHDPALVVHGNFVRHLGAAAMRQLIGRGVEFDAVVAANDAMAFGAVEVLRELGRHVPRDVPMVGFDDLPLARLGNPTLTTVAQPFEAIAATALEYVLNATARGTAVNTVLPTDFVVRRSCGCGVRVFPRLVEGNVPQREAPRVLEEPRVLATIERLLRVRGADSQLQARELLGSLGTELRGTPGAFLNALEALLERARGDNERYRALQNAISWLRLELASERRPELESLFCDAFALIALVNTTAQAQHDISLDETYLRLLRSSEQVSAAFDLTSLKQALERTLPTTGMGTAFVSCYVEGDPSRLEPFVCLVDGKAVDPGVDTFPASAFFPPNLPGFERRKSLLAFPLVFEAERLGLAVFEYDPSVKGYPVVRDQIATALRTVGLHQEVVYKTMQHERSVQERLATAKRMKSLSLLAGGVAHDLNNALGPLVALPDAILSDIRNLNLPESMVAEVCADVLTIQSASLRAAHTIKDLLTLGRQGTTARQPLDLRRVIEQCATNDGSRFAWQSQRQVKFMLDMPAEPLVVKASEPHISRAISNLIRNAVEAIASVGQVTVRGELRVIDEPTTRYETIEPGEYVVITIEDTGSGIQNVDLGRVFEPYFSKKPLADSSGSGLGLAIVHGVVKEHDGFIDVTSVLGSGTSFMLYFPRAAGEPATPTPRRESHTRAARILMVDDDAIQLRTGQRVLGRLGYEITSVKSSQVAYEAATQNPARPFDLLILDMLLSEGEDGLELFERIQRVLPHQRAIVVSGHAPNERAEQAINKGLLWLSKPYTADALADVVESALNGRGVPLVSSLDRTSSTESSNASATPLHEPSSPSSLNQSLPRALQFPPRPPVL
ncbi:MAG TPA: substrate-binding domain-containing protein [Polyangiaceae bacterium]|nr:substrate-binding domain-containing protein [Polyangiaceae bacterium]